MTGKKKRRTPYYAEKSINGVLHYRKNPFHSWKSYTAAELTEKYMKLRRRLNKYVGSFPLPLPREGVVIRNSGLITTRTDVPSYAQAERDYAEAMKYVGPSGLK